MVCLQEPSCPARVVRRPRATAPLAGAASSSSLPVRREPAPQPRKVHGRNGPGHPVDEVLVHVRVDDQSVGQSMARGGLGDPHSPVRGAWPARRQRRYWGIRTARARPMPARSACGLGEMRQTATTPNVPRDVRLVAVALHERNADGPGRQDVGDRGARDHAHQVVGRSCLASSDRQSLVRMAPSPSGAVLTDPETGTMVRAWRSAGGGCATVAGPASSTVSMRQSRHRESVHGILRHLARDSIAEGLTPPMPASDPTAPSMPTPATHNGAVPAGTM